MRGSDVYDSVVTHSFHKRPRSQPSRRTPRCPRTPYGSRGCDARPHQDVPRVPLSEARVGPVTAGARPYVMASREIFIGVGPFGGSPSSSVLVSPPLSHLPPSSTRDRCPSLARQWDQTHEAIQNGGSGARGLEHDRASLLDDNTSGGAANALHSRGDCACLSAPLSPPAPPPRPRAPPRARTRHRPSLRRPPPPCPCPPRDLPTVRPSVRRDRSLEDAALACVAPLPSLPSRWWARVSRVAPHARRPARAKHTRRRRSRATTCDARDDVRRARRGWPRGERE